MEVVEATATVGDVDEFVAALDAVAGDHGVTVQVLDARYVVDRAHLERAVELTDRAFERDDAIARERAVEILLYAAGRRQISEALAMGVSEGETSVVVVVDSAEGDGAVESAAADAVAALDALAPAETLGAFDRERVLTFFDVGEAELAAAAADLPALVRERVALLVVEK